MIGNLNEHFWGNVVENLLGDERFREVLVEGLKRTTKLPSGSLEMTIQRLGRAIDLFHNDLETMQEGEIRAFLIKDRFDVYKINRKIKAIQRKRWNNPDYEEYSFKKWNIDNTVLYLMRNINSETQTPSE